MSMKTPCQTPCQVLESPAGGGLRAALAALWAKLGFGRDRERSPAHRTVAFTIAVTTLAAKMAKADGVALPVEAQAFERLFEIPPREAKNVRRVYNLAKRDVAGYEMHAARIAKLLKDEPVFLSSVLACLFHIAAADGILHPAEDRFLENVATIFRLDRGEYLSIRATYVNDPRSPYAILGLAPNASDAEIKDRYRALARTHHPDRVCASGVPHEFCVAANRRLAAINAAYDAIEKEREGSRRSEPEKTS
jgi:DnaJ like chaperone protein